METKVTEKLIEVISKESKVFAEKDSKLKGSFTKLSKMGINEKSTYTLPLKDTIGRIFREQTQFTTSSENPVVNTGYMQ